MSLENILEPRMRTIMYAQRKSLFGSLDKACLGTKRACEEIKEFTEGCGKYT